MPRVNIPVKTAVANGAAGVDMSLGAVAGDSGQNHLMYNPSGLTLLMVMTLSASGISVTVISVADPYNRTGDLGPTAVGASKVFVFGPFSNLLFSQQSGADVNNVYINVSGISGTATLQGLNIP